MNSIHTEMTNLIGEHSLDTDHHLLAVGNLHMAITADGTVVEEIRSKLFHIRPRAFIFKDNGDLQIVDDHPDWLDNNDETERIGKKYIDLLVVVSNVDSLTVPPAADYVLEVPDISVPDSVEIPIGDLVHLTNSNSQLEAYNRYRSVVDE